MSVLQYLYKTLQILSYYWRSERACASEATIRSSKWKSAMDIWYMQFYLEAIGGACRVEGRGFEPRCGTFFFPLPNFFLLSFFSLSFFFSPLVSFFSSPFHYLLQARSATSMLKHFSSYYNKIHAETFLYNNSTTQMYSYIQQLKT